MPDPRPPDVDAHRNDPQHIDKLDIDALVADPSVRIVVCCGAGGVGKTTTAAALALRAAEQHGRRAVVLTIDPARRLAQSLGLTELDNQPRLVETAGAGELHAMMLDMKRTFDEVVEAHTDPQRAEEIFANPFYQAMSTTFSGTQEYMAMEKLGQLRATEAWDLIVVDTPPSRSALDFLDAPARLARFLDGRMLRMLLAPARAGGRSMFQLVTASFGMFSKTVQRVLGTQLLRDLSGFVDALDSMFGGFRARSERTYQILQHPQTAFLLVAAPETDAVREARYFAARLVTERMPLHGMVLNRVRTTAASELSAAESRRGAHHLDGVESEGTHRDGTDSDGREGNGREGNGRDSAHGDDAHAATATALRIHAALMEQVRRDERIRGQFTDEFPQIPVVSVPAQPTDVYDLTGLRTVGTALASAPASH